jgi:alpha-tubulin suppressor-like RCC1 family protein
MLFYRKVEFFDHYGAKVKQVSCGAHHTLILTTDGEVLACGVGEYGRLGIGSSEDAYIPTTLVELTEVDISHVVASHNHSACLSSEGKLYTWGKNDIGQLGHPDTYMDVLYSQEEFPRLVDTIPGKIIQISLTKGRSSAITEEGQLYIWGAQFEHTPTLIPPDLFEGLKIKKVLSTGGTGGIATLIITEDGTLWSFGDIGSWTLGRKLTDIQKSGMGKDLTPKRVPIFANPSDVNSDLGTKVGRVLDIYGGLGKHVIAKVEAPKEV